MNKVIFLQSLITFTHANLSPKRTQDQEFVFLQNSLFTHHHFPLPTKKSFISGGCVHDVERVTACFILYQSLPILNIFATFWSLHNHPNWTAHFQSYISLVNLCICDFCVFFCSIFPFLSTFLLSSLCCFAKAVYTMQDDLVFEVHLALIFFPSSSFSSFYRSQSEHAQIVHHTSCLLRNSLFK